MEGVSKLPTPVPTPVPTSLTGEIVRVTTENAYNFIFGTGELYYRVTDKVFRRESSTRQEYSFDLILSHRRGNVRNVQTV